MEEAGSAVSGVCTGFLGSSEQISIVERFLTDFKRPETKVIVDPVMGDYGKPYPTYTDELCQQMKSWCGLLISLLQIPQRHVFDGYTI